MGSKETTTLHTLTHFEMGGGGGGGGQNYINIYTVYCLAVLETCPFPLSCPLLKLNPTV